MGKRYRMLSVPFRARDVRRSTAWAWAIEIGADKWQLGRWSHPSKASLLATEKPSPGARPVQVTLVPTSGMYRVTTDPTPAEGG